jgi:DNA recombination protein RmuC
LRVPGLEDQLEKVRDLLTTTKDELTELKESTSRESSRLEAELTAEREAMGHVRQEAADLRRARETLGSQVVALSNELTELRTRTEEERQHADEKVQMLLEAKEALTNQFKSLASDILEEKSKRFAEQNQTSIGQLLEPLKTQLTEFKGKVEEVYLQEGKDRSALSEQVRNLVSLNQTLSQDAKNLTLALKGQAKTQGNWGELILERVLEASGLRKDHEYKVQDSQTREDGTRAQPDVVIELPEDRKLVVDAKVSLVAYDRYVSADTDDERAVAIREHLNSVRAHIKGLSEKQYHALYGLQSLDFVLAFVPVEPAFMLAVTNDNELFMDAWQRNVLLVSPSTLLFVVRTVAHLWRQEAQSRNAQVIAKRGAELYDKLSGFVTDLQKVGDRLRMAKEAFDDAQGKLSTGKGNAIRQAEMLRDLGVKPAKELPPALVQRSMADDDVTVSAFATLASPGATGTDEVMKNSSPQC